MVSKELAAHKEMVGELRKQLVEKENELQVHIQCIYCIFMFMYTRVYVYTCPWYMIKKAKQRYTPRAVSHFQ